MTEALFEWGDVTEGHAPILIHHLWGALDAGDAGQLTITQILGSLKSRRVATFDTDKLIDFRSRRPVASLEDWCISDMTGPELAIDELQDYSGQKFLVLHGPEPDFHWDGFSRAVAMIAEAFDVDMAVNVMGMPAGVPHTRSTFVHQTATDPAHVPNQPGKHLQLKMTSSFDIFMQHRLGLQGVTSMGIVAGVPYYLADGEFPQSSVALLDKIVDITHLKLPVGDLEAAATQMRLQLDNHMEQSEEMAQLIHVMEERYDATLAEDPPAAGFLHEASLRDEEPSGDALAEQIEAFLKGRSNPIIGDSKSHNDTPALFGPIPKNIPQPRQRFQTTGDSAATAETRDETRSDSSPDPAADVTGQSRDDDTGDARGDGEGVRDDDVAQSHGDDETSQGTDHETTPRSRRGKRAACDAFDNPSRSRGVEGKRQYPARKDRRRQQSGSGLRGAHRADEVEPDSPSSTTPSCDTRPDNHDRRYPPRRSRRKDQ